MSSLASYLLESSVCLLAWYAFYRMFLYKDTNFRLSRIFLLTAVASALVLPLLSIPMPAWGSNSNTLQFNLAWQQVIVLPEIEVKADGPSSSTNWLQLLAYWPYAYFAGMAFFTSRMLVQLYTIYKLNRKAHHTFVDGYKVVMLPGNHPIFTFGKAIYWNEKISLQEPEAQVILKHEIAHIRQLHTADLIFFEVARLVFWFNPLLILYKNSLREIHEFEADRLVVKNTNAHAYASVLLQQVFGTNLVTLSHSFNQSQLKRRIAMLTKNSISKASWFKACLALPLLGLLFYTFSCSPGNMAAEAGPQAVELLSPELIQEEAELLTTELEEIYDKHPEAEMKVSITKDGNTKQIALSTDQINNEKDKARINVIARDLTTLYTENDNIAAEVKDKPVAPQSHDYTDEVFMVVEDQPTPQGGMQAFADYLKNNLRYPDQARTEAAEGRVFVEFIIGTDGLPTEVKAIKGIGFGCDEEAVRVVKNMPAWKPGMQRGQAVRVRMVIPIVFKLS